MTAHESYQKPLTITLVLNGVFGNVNRGSFRVPQKEGFRDVPNGGVVGKSRKLNICIILTLVLQVSK